MKKALHLFIVLFITNFINAQTRFEDGHYINNAGEKIQGLIKNLDWRSNPTSFEFKTTENSEIQVIGIDKASEFNIENKRKFVKVNVDFETSSNQYYKAGINKEPVFTKRTLFLEEIVAGKATLYSYFEENENKFFYSLDKTPVKQLIAFLYKINDLDVVKNESMKGYSSGDILKNETYKRQLWTELRSENISSKNIETLQYKTDDLVDFFNKYNNHKGDKTPAIQKNKKKVTYNFKVSGIYNNSSLDVFAYTEKYSPRFKNSSIALGFEAEFNLPYNNNKWSLIIEPSINTFKGEKTTLYSNGTPTETVETNFKYLQIPIGIRHYFYLNDTSKIFVNGFGNIRMVGGSYFVDYEKSTDYKYAPLSITFGAGIGYTYNKISAEARMFFASGSSISETTTRPTEFRNLSFIVRYQIFQKK